MEMISRRFLVRELRAVVMGLLGTEEELFANLDIEVVRSDIAARNISCSLMRGIAVCSGNQAIVSEILVDLVWEDQTL
jgi:hypothetical protein